MSLPQRQQSRDWDLEPLFNTTNEHTKLNNQEAESLRAHEISQTSHSQLNMGTRLYELPHPVTLMPRRNTPIPLKLQTTALDNFSRAPRMPLRQNTHSTIASDSHVSQASVRVGAAHPPSIAKPAHAVVTTTTLSQAQKTSLSRSSSSSTSDFEPEPLSRAVTITPPQTTYMRMLLGLDKISSLDNVLIAFFNWIILAGFLIFPATYVSLAAASKSETINNNAVAREALKAVQHVPLLVMAYACCGFGCLGIFWLWWKLRLNYVWLCNKIFFTVCLNSLAGLISTLVGVYGQKDGFWSLQAIITAGVTGGVFVIAGVLYLLYNFVFLAKVRERHDAEMKKWEELGV